MEHLALERAGVFHADHDAREQHFERARRREVKARPDLAQVGHHRLGAFRTGHAEAGNEALRVVEIVIADPGQWQIGQRHIFLGQLVENDRVARRLDRALAGQHHTLRGPRGARGVEDDRRIGAFGRGDLSIEPGAERCIGGERLAAVGDDIFHRTQMTVVVIAKAARLVVDHPFELRQLVLDRLDLVDLLLILDQSKAHVGMRQHERQFLGDSVGINRHWDSAQRLRRHHRPIKLRPVRADNGHGLAAPHAEPVQAGRVGPHDLEHLSPGPGLPDAEVLVPHGRPRPVQAGVAQQ